MPRIALKSAAASFGAAMVAATDSRASRRWAAGALVALCATPVGAVSETGHADCTVCHVEADSPTLMLPERLLCIACHEGYELAGHHPIGSAPTEAPFPSLPLPDGLMSCGTCHDVHAESSALLRLPAGELCDACHRV